MRNALWCLNLILGLLVLAGGWEAWRMEVAAQALRAAAARLPSPEVQQRTAHDLAAEEAALQQRLAALAAEKSKQAAARAESRPAPRVTSAAYRTLLVSAAKNNLDGDYARLFQTLVKSGGAVDGPTLDRLKQLLAERQILPFDLTTLRRQAAQAGTTADPAALTAYYRSAVVANDAAIQQTLGNAGYAAFVSYQQALPAKSVTDQFVQRLTLSGIPLSDAQTEQVQGLLAGSLTSTSIALSPTLVGGYDAALGLPLTDAAVTAAGSVLSADQLAQLKQLQADQQARQQIQLALRRARQAVAAEAAAARSEP